MRRLILVLLLLFVLTACGVVEEVLPDLAPSVSNTPESDSGSSISPRLAPEVLPPTWTPVLDPSLLPVDPGNSPADGSGAIDTTGLQTYEVQAGDTLLDIAILFDISLERMIQVNNIQDTDHIEVGTTLYIPEA